MTILKINRLHGTLGTAHLIRQQGRKGIGGFGIDKRVSPWVVGAVMVCPVNPTVGSISLIPLGGVGRGKALQKSLKNGCSNGYPATNDYYFGANHRDIYVGVHIKF